jgi:4-amino-4-deoxy-L-arabinose transferase-like glycosyltransferase
MASGLAGGSKSSARRFAWHVPLLVALGLPVFFFGLDRYSLVNGDEGFYHTVAALMLERGDWFYLDFHGQHRVYDTFMNAPTQYWVRALLIRAIGDNPWSMRLPSATFGLLTVLVTYRLAREVGRSDARDPDDALPGASSAFCAALVQLTCYQFVYLHGARTGELDAVLSFLLAAIALRFLIGVRDGTGFVGHHVCLALLLTLKLPTAVIPVLGELALFATTPCARRHFRRYVVTGLAIVPLGLVWHAFQAAWWWDELFDVAGRMGDAAAGIGAEKVTGTPLENARWYGERLLFGAFPWSIAMVPALGAAVVGALKRKGGEAAALGPRVIVLSLLAVLGFYVAVGQRHPWYILPAYPFLAVCTGAWIARLARGVGVAGVLAAAATLTVVAWVIVPLDQAPLTQRAPLVPMDVGVRAVDGIATPLGAGLLFVLLAGGLFAARDALGARAGCAGRVVSATVLLVLFPYAALRVGYPLASLEHESELERLFEDVEGRRLSGRRVKYPVVIPEDQGYLKISYYFGRNYRLVRKRGPDGPVVFVEGEKEHLTGQR